MCLQATDVAKCLSDMLVLPWPAGRPMIGFLVLAVILLLAIHSLFYVESVRGSVFVVKFLSALRSLRFSVRE